MTNDRFPVSRPKILTAITVPSAGWQMKVEFSISTQYATDITFTIPTGTYFMADDNQSDCFLYQLNYALFTAIKAEATMGGSGFWLGYECLFYIDPATNYVKFAAEGSNYDATAVTGGFRRDIRFPWSAYGDMDDIAKVLGFDAAATTTLTGTNNPVATASYRHGYGWYSEEDGQLESLGWDDDMEILAAQSFCPTGESLAHQYGEHYKNNLKLSFLTRQQLFSGGVDYCAKPVYPLEWNRGLECWFRAAAGGSHFRVYRDGRVHTSHASDSGLTTAAGDNSLTDAAKSWQSDNAAYGEPDRWIGRIAYIPDTVGANLVVPQKLYISGNATSTLSFSNASVGHGIGEEFAIASGAQYYIMEHTYKTYVLDLSEARFEPEEIPNINRYSITLPLRKYV